MPRYSKTKTGDKLKVAIRPYGNRTSYNSDAGMSRRYGQGLERGRLLGMDMVHREFYLDEYEITYPEIWKVIQSKGKITLRNKSYPMVFITLSLLDHSEANLIKAIGKKLRWSHLKTWSKGLSVQLVWEGERAKELLKKLLIYLPRDSKDRETALMALKWFSSKESNSEENANGIATDPLMAWYDD